MAEELDQHVQGLREGAALAGGGGFTIDRERAREKLRAFQLASPHDYVLVLVEAMVLRGATWIAFEIDSDDVRMSADVTISAAELDQLYASIFADGAADDRRLRGLQELALAVNAAMASEPRFVRIESGGAPGVRLELRPERADRLEEVDELAHGTRVHVRDRFSLFEALKIFGGVHAEAKVLRERCRWSSVPVSIGGVAISGGLVDEGLHLPLSIEGEGFQGVIGWRAVGDQAGVDILSNGVWILRHEIDGLFRGINARVDARDLRRDISRRGLVRDDRFAAIIDAVRGAAAAAIERLAAAVVAGDAAARPWGSGRVLAWLFGHTNTRDLAALARDAPSLLDVPCWRSTAGGLRSCNQLAAEDGPIPYAVAPIERLPEEHAWAIEVATPLAGRRLAAIFGERALDLGPAIERERARRAGMEAFEGRAFAPILPPGHYLGEAKIAYPGVEGAVGLRTFGLAGWELYLVHRGRLLHRLRPELPLDSVTAVVSGELTPSPLYDRALADEGLARALVAVLAAIEGIMIDLASRRARLKLVRRYIEWAISGDHVIDLLVSAGFTPQAAVEVLAAVPGGVELRRGGASWLRRDAHPLASAEVMVDGRRRRLSLVDLQRELGARGSITWLRDRKLAGDVRLPEHVLLLDDETRGLVARVFGEAALVDFEPTLAAMVDEARFRGLPIEGLRPTAAAIAEVEIDAEGIVGTVVALHPREGWSNQARLRALKERRLLDEVTISLPLAGVAATVNGDGLLRQRGGLDGADRRLLGRLVRGALPELVLAALVAAERASSANEGPLRAFLLHALLALVGPWPRLWALARLSAAGEASAWHRIIDLDRRRGEAALTAALEGLHRADAMPSVEAIRRALAEGKDAEGEAEEREVEELAALRHELADRLPELLRRVLLRSREGGPCSVDELARALVKRESIAWVEGDLPEGSAYGRRIAVLGEGERRALEPLVGAANLTHLRAWLLSQIVGDRLAEREVRASLAIPPAMIAARVVLDPAIHRFEGELGVAWRAPPAIEVCCARRPILTLDPGLPLPLVGALSADDLAVFVGLDGIPEGEREAIVELCEEAMEPLVEAIAGAWGSLDELQRRTLTPHLLALLGAARAGAGRRGSALARAAARVRAIPLFAMVDGGLATLEELHALHRAAGLFHVRDPWLGDPPDAAVVHLASLAAFDLVSAEIPGIRDYLRRWMAEQASARRLDEAPPLPRRRRPGPSRPRRSTAAGSRAGSGSWTRRVATSPSASAGAPRARGDPRGARARRRRGPGALGGGRRGGRRRVTRGGRPADDRRRRRSAPRGALADAFEAALAAGEAPAPGVHARLVDHLLELHRGRQAARARGAPAARPATRSTPASPGSRSCRSVSW
ncbi:MAG: hypothetical protein H6710_07835 [Myxococcales bacterium]|nr:hypothetical protein [Myxococcales bacterium]